MAGSASRWLVWLGLVLASSCVNDPATVACPKGLSSCSGVCVNTQFDLSHCGECERPCADGELCSLGMCGSECLGGSVQCGAMCVDTDNDPAHCGQCDSPCPTGACMGGNCLGACEGGLVSCGSECVDIMSDPDHCNGCDQPCGDGATCSAGMCRYAPSCLAILARAPSAATGVQTIDVDGNGPLAPIAVHCDMSTDGGGWTLVLNLDTSDGHVMWWADPLWTDEAAYGTADTALTQDHKSGAWSEFTGATELLLLIHQEGLVRGWKRFNKVDGSTMSAHLQGGDNTLVGTAVVAEDTATLWQGERLVRLSTQLYANHCSVNMAGCVSGAGGASDGDRIGSNEATPVDNNGGGLGNWHDMGYCCTGEDYGSGKNCNGQSFRTASEAQAGWASCYNSGQGFFGSDTFGPASNVCNNVTCGDAAYSEPNGIEYDYAIYLR